MVVIEAVGDFTVRKDSGTNAESEDGLKWKVEWFSISGVDCGTIHPGTMGKRVCP